ncbi:hypothetical protein TSUD_13470 [Trifolium subterraneum]|uniref:Disease resistance protein At4g27190-like leucine-rich repeats domain-containing protein n=1 Tax=Trifolium subterraneum TaxID=3900 RepID=A0A2Z6P074_TRISU|nr:hypothetical protein TSUD_13470 [Trifolium subterraneum]
MDVMSLSEHQDLQQAWYCGDGHMKSWFCSLKTLKLEGCQDLSFAIPAKILPHLKSLKELEVSNCNNVTAIFEKSDTAATPFQLKNLTLKILSKLVNVWEKNFKGNLIFQNLQQVFVSNCENLETLFPAALARNLKKLEKLEINSCENLLQIIEQETDKEEKFVFPCLTWLDLYGLPKLAYFYPGIFTLECPKLHKLSVLSCSKLEIFHTTHPEGDRQPLFSDLKVIPILEELTVDLNHELTVDLDLITPEEYKVDMGNTLLLKPPLQQLTEDLNFLKKVSIFDMDELNIPTFCIDILEKAPNLQDLSIEWCNSLKIFLTVDERGIPGQLKTLTLNRVSKLQYISLENSWLNTVSMKCHKLNVSHCHDLTKLFHSPSVASFYNLKELYISDCHELEYLFTSSVANLLKHLEEITVKASHKIKEIVAKEQDGTTCQEIKFERLYCINLDSLSSLECFYSGKDILELPSLTQVDIWQCPKMEVFSQGEINLKSFRGIQTSTDSNNELFFHNDLNTSINRAILLKMLSKGMDEISFSKHPELQEAWHGRVDLQNNWLYTLRTLKLYNCDFKQYAISSNILHCLKNLKELEVRNCNKVEVIFDMNAADNMEMFQLNNLTLEGLSELTSVWANNCQGIIVFRNLRRVSISRCKSIQALLPATLAKKLTVLEKLEIKYCEKLEVIVRKEEDATADVTKKIVFPRLSSFELYLLPKLASFYPDIFTVECPRLNNMYVMDCPKLELFHSAHHEDVAKSSSTSINRQPLFSDSKAIPILETLILDQKHISGLRLVQPRKSLKHLNTIHLWFHSDENEKPTFPYEIFEIAPNLQEMVLECCDHIFLTQNHIFSEHELIGHLRILKLYKVSKLKFIGSRDSSWLNKVCEEISKLIVQICPDLTTLLDSAPAVSFSNLKELYITECRALEYLFTSSTAKKLIHIEKITVKECGSMKTVVAKDEDEAPQGVEFKLLCCIDLISLSGLDCFYQGNDILQLPSLVEVNIWHCPKMKVFSYGEIHAKQFRGIQVSSNSKNSLPPSLSEAFKCQENTKIIVYQHRAQKQNLSDSSMRRFTQPTLRLAQQQGREHVQSLETMPSAAIPTPCA